MWWRSDVSQNDLRLICLATRVGRRGYLFVEECWRLSSTAPELCEIAVAHAVVVAVVLQ